MCYSANASLVALATGLFFSGWLYKNGNVSFQIIALFTGFVSLMQGIEYLLWKHPICDTYHKSISVLGMILNHSQPLLLAALLLFFNPTTKNTSTILYLSLFYLLIMIPYSSQFVTNEALQCTTPQEGNPHLVWNWILMPYYPIAYSAYLLLLFVLPILGLPDKKLGYIFAMLTTIAYGTSSYMYERPTFGSLWCYYTALTPALLVGVKEAGILF